MIWPVVTASFLASLVEFVEALTIILAVGVVRGWKSALLGVAAAVVVLTLLVVLFAKALERVPLHSLQVAIGVLLLLFGIRWLRKAVLRAGGYLGLHDEAKIFEKTTKKLGEEANIKKSGTDPIAFGTSFQAVMIEGLEVIFIVIATGAGGNWLQASLGAAVAGLLVILLGLIVHKPLTQIPENSLKYAVGVILTAFGTFWIGEGAGIKWPGSDLSLVWMVIGYLLCSFFGVWLVRNRINSGTTAGAKS